MACVTPPANIVSWWPGDGDAKDIAQGNGGTLLGGATFTPAGASPGSANAGEVAQAFALDGAQAFVDSGKVVLGTQGPFSIETWINTKTFGSYQAIVSEIGSENATGQFQFRIAQTGLLQFFRRATDGRGVVLLNTSVAVPIGQWVHVAAVFGAADDNDLHVFINGMEDLGEQISSSTYSTTFPGTTKIGNADPEPGSYYFDGLIDEPTIYSRALSADEIHAIYAAGTAGKCKRRKVVVLLQGINTSLICTSDGQCQPGDPDGNPTNTFGQLRSLLAGQGFAAEDILWYSYTAGRVDRSSGTWFANTYYGVDTKRRYESDISDLQLLINDYTGAHPGTDFYLVGHSQGGLVAFQELAFISDLSADATVKAVFTLDSPLGGLTEAQIQVAATTCAFSDQNCWGTPNPAGIELLNLYGTNPVAPLEQGDQVQPLCSTLGICPGVPNTNEDLVSLVRSGSNPTDVHTYGNLNDAVYSPSQCGAPEPPFTDVVSSQIVSSADDGAAGLGAWGGNTPTPRPGLVRPAWLKSDQVKACTARSHGQIIIVKSPVIAALIGSQVHP